MEDRFSGVFAALFTPFNEREEVCKRRLKKLVKFLVAKGVNLYICGSTGEGLLMSVEERKLVAEVVKETAEDKVKIIAHVGTLNTKDAIELAKHSEKIGLDGISSIAPTYYKYTFNEIFDYYKAIADSSSLPFLIYHVPIYTGVILTNDEIAKLSQIKNVIGLKYTDTNLYVLQDLLNKVGGRWIAFSGADEMFLPALTMGVSGCIGTTVNILPELFIGIYNSFRSGDIDKAMALQRKLNIAISILYEYEQIAPWKAALKFRGIDVGYARPPHKRRLTAEEEGKIQKVWKENLPEFSEALRT